MNNSLITQDLAVSVSIARAWARLGNRLRQVGISFLLLWVTASHGAVRPPWNSNRVVGSPKPPAPYTIERKFSALTFKNPVDIGTLPGTDRLLVLEQAGRLLSFAGTNTAEHAELVFDFRPHHQPFDSSYAFALHPHFLENRFIFVCYVEPGGRTNGSYISRFKLLAANPPVIDPQSEKVILRWLSGGHNGCTLAFGNDGFLYISTGDASNPDPPDLPIRTGQDISDLLSSILRIDVDKSEGTNAYTIPPGNPFAKTAGARPEIFAFGLRNPWRMSFDPSTGDLWVGDVGWEQWEMVYRVKPGGNYGWSITEGPNPRVRTDVTQGPGPILPPLIALPHSEAASITGGRVYHGNKLATLRGAYVYGDWETGKFWALRNEGDKLLSNEELCDTTLKPTSFAADFQGELLILDYNGGIYGFATNSAAPANLAFPRKLSETGLFADVAAANPAPGVVSYQINAPMWNDYATAERWLGVPDNERVATAGGRETIAGRMWFFPSNTVFARTVSLEKKRGEPSSRKRVETQVLHFEGQTWNAYTYRWNDAQSDAELVPAEGASETFILDDPAAPGGRREIPWRFAGRAECLRCHNAWAGETLSFNWLQLTRSTRGAEAASAMSGSELQRLAELGVLQIKEPPAPLLSLVNPYAHAAETAERARSWLHVNCSTCHRNGAGGDVPAWFNYDLPIEKSRAYDARPVRGDFGILAARVIAPSDPYRSTLLYRINTEGSGRMPHIGSRVVDEEGARLLRDWIRSLSPVVRPDPDMRVAEKLARDNRAWLAPRIEGERPEAVANLLASTSGALALLSETTDPAARAELGSVAASHTNALVRDLLQRLLPPNQRRQTLGTDFNPQTVLALHGNAARGRELFLGVSQCARCHTCEGMGRAFGPDLSGISRKYSRPQVLEQILYPSQVVAPEFKTVLLTLRDDTELTGFVLKRSPTELLFRDEKVAERIVKLSEVKETRDSALSSMPEGLLAPLTALEVADLLEFLTTSKAP